MFQRRLSILIVAAKWWPLSARLAIALIDQGCRVSAVCPKGHPLTRISRLHAMYAYSGLRSLASLRQNIMDCRPDVIVPCDDGVVAQLHALYRQEPSLRTLIQDSLGAHDHYEIVASRYKLLQTATQLGIAAPRSRLVSDPSDIAAWHRDDGSAVLKLDGECGGNGVRICHSSAESLVAWRELTTRSSLALAFKRFAIERDPLALWSRRQHDVRQVCIQALVRGRPANAMMACFQGTMVSLVSVIVLVADGPTGAATVVRTTDNAEMARAAKLLAGQLQLTGFYGLDFMIDASTGAALLIELNPRCTQLGHLQLSERGSLASAFTAALQGRPIPEPDHAAKATTVAFFPQAFTTDSGTLSQRSTDIGYCDIPNQEPKLLRELTLEPWPRRRWLARLYHLARPPKRPHPVVFEDSGNSVPLELEYPATRAIGLEQSPAPRENPPNHSRAPTPDRQISANLDSSVQ